MLNLFRSSLPVYWALGPPSPYEVQALLATAERQLRDVDGEIQRLRAADHEEQISSLLALRERLEENIRLTRATLEAYAPEVTRVSKRPRPALTELPPFTETIGPAGRRGITSSGFQVARLQQVLTALGFPCPITGKFNPATSKALAGWQASAGHEPSGILDVSSRETLNRLMRG